MWSRTPDALQCALPVLGFTPVTLLAVRVHDTHRRPDLQPWHAFVPEFGRNEIDGMVFLFVAAPAARASTA